MFNHISFIGRGRVSEEESSVGLRQSKPDARYVLSSRRGDIFNPGSATADSRIGCIDRLGTKGEGVNQSSRAVGGQAGERQLVAALAEAEGRVKRSLARLAVAIEYPVFSRRKHLCIGEVEARAGFEVL